MGSAEGSGAIYEFIRSVMLTRNRSSPDWRVRLVHFHVERGNGWDLRKRIPSRSALTLCAIGSSPSRSHIAYPTISPAFVSATSSLVEGFNIAFRAYRRRVYRKDSKYS